jgi:hypothetical protein
MTAPVGKVPSSGPAGAFSKKDGTTEPGAQRLPPSAFRLPPSAFPAFPLSRFSAFRLSLSLFPPPLFALELP